MSLKDIEVGQKFIYRNKMFLRVDMKPSTVFQNVAFDELIAALDLSTYKIMCFNDSWEVEYYGDNVPV